MTGTSPERWSRRTAGVAGRICLLAVVGLWLGACSPDSEVVEGKKAADAAKGGSDGGEIPDGGSLDTAGSDAATAQPDAGPPADIWAWVGDTQGGQFVQLEVPADPNTAFHGCASSGTKRAYVAGTNGTVIGWDGIGWKVLTESVFSTLNAIAAPANGLRAFAAGMAGTVIQTEAAGPGQLGTQWGPPGGCAKASDCDKYAPTCTYSVCDSGVCKYAPTGGPGCCGGVNFGDGFKNMGNWKVTDVYAKDPSQGGIVWTAASMQGKDGSDRVTSPPKAMYFGLTDKACANDKDKFCPSFNNGKVVASTARSAPIEVPIASKVTLTFQLFMDTEAGLNGDALLLRVYKPGYATKVLWDKTALDGGGSTGGKFKLQTVDLTEYAGSTIELEFLFDSKDAFLNDGEGVFIDDLLLKTTCPAGTVGTKGLTSSTFFDVWAADDDHAWAVGADGAVARWLSKVSPDGGSKQGAWSMMTSDTNADIYAMGGVPGVLQLGVGDKGLIAEIAPSGMAAMTNAYPFVLKGVAATDLGDGKAHAVAVGIAGTVLEWTGSKWNKVAAPALVNLEDVTAMGGSQYYAVGSNQVMRRNASGSWQLVGTVPGTLSAVSSMGPLDAVAVGPAGLVVFIKNGALQPQEKALGTMACSGVHAVAPDDIWVVGGSAMTAHWDGTKWTGVPAPKEAYANLNDVWASGKGDVWAVGLAGSIMHHDGTKWTLEKAPKLDYISVWGSDPNDVYASAKGGLLARWDGKSWKLLVAPVEGNLRAVWASGPEDIWAVGENAAIFHSTGGGWGPVTIDPYEVPEGDPYEVSVTLLAIWGSAPDDIWAAGYPDKQGEGVLIHYDGKSWKYVPALKSEGRVFRAIWGWGKDDVLFAGTQGMLYHYDGEAFTALDSGFKTTLYDICGFGKDALIVGGFGTVLRYIPPLKQPEDEQKE